MPPSTVNTAFEYAEQLLAVCEEATATTIGGTPARSYVAHATPAFDCTEQLTVHVAGIDLFQTDPTSPAPVVGKRFKDGMIHRLALTVTVIRCTPQPSGAASSPPSVVELAELSQKCAQDLWAIWNLIHRRMSEGDLFAGTCSLMQYDGGVPSVESGAAAGWFVNISASIPGYHPLDGS